jgi:multiple sugar transport system permease protein
VKLLGADVIGENRAKTPKPAGRRKGLRTVAKGDTP